LFSPYAALEEFKQKNRGRGFLLLTPPFMIERDPL